MKLRKIYDLTQELFGAEVFPGDPVPARTRVLALEQGDSCQLTEMRMGSHSGTHLDAPCHFIEGGKGTDTMNLSRCIGMCRLVEAEGKITAELVRDWLSDGCRRLLIRGQIEITPEAARAMAEADLYLLGVEGMTVGSFANIAAVHKILLGHEIVIVESLRMGGVPEGDYLLSALPLKMEGLDGSPVRAVLVEIDG